MARTFELPDPGEGVHEAEVVEVHVAPDDRVSESDILLEVETDKAVVEIPAPFSGRIVELLVEKGDDVRVGEGILTWEPGNGDAEASEDGAEEEEAAAESERGESERENGREQEEEREGESREERRKAPSDSRPVPAAPATRRLARELGVELERVEGSGPEGRVTDKDVRRAADGEEKAPAEKEEEPVRGEEPEKEDGAPEEEKEPEEGEKPSDEEPRPGPKGVPDYGDPGEWGPLERQPLRSVRRTTARRMADAWRRIPHVTHVDHADITELEAFRKEHDQAMEGVDLSLTVFLLKALVATLKEFPRFNARLDEDAGEIVVLGYHHIGVAVDSERGLLVPVLRDVDARSLAELAKELEELARATRNREISRDQMRGGSFTLTNPGPLGGDFFTPIINPPQVAILGLGRAALRPVVRQGEGEEPVVEPRLLLPLCLAFDHRVNDGADAARFTGRLVELLEDPDTFVRHL